MKYLMNPKESFFAWLGHFIVRLIYILAFVTGIAFSIYWVASYLEL